jgi:hypothetical protein
MFDTQAEFRRLTLMLSLYAGSAILLLAITLLSYFY